MIVFSIAKQNLFLKSGALIAGGSSQVFKFEFDRTWEGLRRFAVFSAGGGDVEMEIVDGECELLQEVAGGIVTVGVYGTNDSGLVLPTNTKDVKVAPSAISPRARMRTATSAQPTQMYMQSAPKTLEVVNRSVVLPSDFLDVAIATDNVSKLVRFKFPRYFEGEDMSEKTVSILFENALEQGDKSLAADKKIEEEYIFFSWLIDAKVTADTGDVKFQLEFLGADGYKWQTNIATFKVNPALQIIGSITPPEDSWLESWTIAADQNLTACTAAAQAAASSATAADTSNAATKASETNANASAATAAAKATEATASATAAALDANSAKSEADRAASFTRDLGLFETAEALVAAYPTAVDNAFARVAATSTYWEWDEQTLTWTNSLVFFTGSSYAQLPDKPMLNGVTLSPTNNTLEAHGIASITALETATADKVAKNEQGNAAQIQFDDGETFQQKLTGGTLKGDKGDKGVQGIQGIPGAKGEKGDAGAAGKDGAPGAKGDPGTDGAPGVKGDKGDTGAAGATGAKGDTGANGTDGAKGDKGDTGAQGTPGVQGERGLQGPQGVQGERGEKGDKGDLGADGAKGDTGAAGATGAQGIQGAPGNDGAKGEAGEKGADGAPGTKGDRGADGAAGQDGLTTQISLNDATYTQQGGTITLPNYPDIATPITTHNNALDVHPSILWSGTQAQYDALPQATKTNLIIAVVTA